MLLPSAFPFDTLHQPRRPTSTSTPPPSSPGGLISLSSCRALQAILGNRPASPLSFILSTAPRRKKDKSATSTRSEQSQRTPLLPLTQNTKVPQRPHTRSRIIRPLTEPRRTNKRTRADFEKTDENDLSSSSSNSKADPEYFSHPHPCCSFAIPTPNTTLLPPPDRHIDTFSTPKRQRRIPLLMPLGLSAQDFQGLDPTPKPLQPHALQEPAFDQSVDLPINYTCTTLDDDDDDDAAAEASGFWSTADDRMLVSTVLDKLHLSRKDWDDCGRRMGKEDGDSLGKRWRVLVRDGEAGLRRGSGGRSRPELREDWKEGLGGTSRIGQDRIL